MESISKVIWIERLLRWFLGITFIYASIHKIIDPAEFAKIIYGYGLFPHFAINMIAIILPFVELVTGLFLLFGIYPKAAATIIGVLLVTFILAVTINLLRGYEFDCGCFSFNKNDTLSGRYFLLVRDIIFLMICLYLLRFKVKRHEENK